MDTLNKQRRKSPHKVRTANDSLEIVDFCLNSEDNENVKKSKKPLNSRKVVMSEEITQKKISPRKTRNARTPSIKALENMAAEQSPSNFKDSIHESSSNGHRSYRKKSPNKKYINDSFQTGVIKRHSLKKPVPLYQISSDSATDNNYSDTSDADNEISEHEFKRATTLFEDNQDVEGQQVYGFKTPKKRNAMELMAINTPKTPKESRIDELNKEITNLALKTPKSSKSAASNPKTPYHLRAKLKNKLTKIVQHVDSASDFSASESDFNPESSSSSDSYDEEQNFIESEEEKEKKNNQKAVSLKTEPKTVTTEAISLRRSTRKKNDYQYVLQSDDYFTTHSTSKIVTSDYTLDRLKTPRLQQEQLFNILKTMKLTNEHEKIIKEFANDYKAVFNKWLYILNEGYSILLYGLGSKRNLLQTFHNDILKHNPVCVINGFFPSLTIKNILDSITSDILDMALTCSNLNEIVDIIEDEFSYIPDTHLYLIIHNIDGIMLRNNKAQSILSRLAKIRNIHLLASIDHINTPLLWDHTKLSNYNFSWWDVTTMLSYKEETAFENSLLVQNSGVLALSSMKSVYQSLTTNARGIYLVIVKNQIKNKGNPNYQGLAFKDLYWSCREAFLVSSDLALRAQLTEFLDHKLVKIKRTSDGIENLTIPIEYNLLQQFIEQQTDN